MTLEEWELRLEEVEDDLRRARHSNLSTAEADVKALRDYASWLKTKLLKATLRPQPAKET